MKGWGQSGYMLKRIRVFSQWWGDETVLQVEIYSRYHLFLFMLEMRKEKDEKLHSDSELMSLSKK